MIQIPTTRPKSPKLGRRKSSSPADAEASVTQNHPKGRLSLGDKVSHDKPAKASFPTHTQKPQRKSLPKLPSQKITLSKKTTHKASPSTQDLNNETVNSAAELNQTENVTEIKAVVELENGQAVPAPVQDPLAEEQ